MLRGSPLCSYLLIAKPTKHRWIVARTVHQVVGNSVDNSVRNFWASMVLGCLMAIEVGSLLTDILVGVMAGNLELVSCQRTLLD